jgi:hypothetical protein
MDKGNESFCAVPRKEGRNGRAVVDWLEGSICSRPLLVIVNRSFCILLK